MFKSFLNSSTSYLVIAGITLLSSESCMALRGRAARTVVQPAPTPVIVRPAPTPVIVRPAPAPVVQPMQDPLIAHYMGVYGTDLDGLLTVYSVPNEAALLQHLIREQNPVQQPAPAPVVQQRPPAPVAQPMQNPLITHYMDMYETDLDGLLTVYSVPNEEELLLRLITEQNPVQQPVPALVAQPFEKQGKLDEWHASYLEMKETIEWDEKGGKRLPYLKSILQDCYGFYRNQQLNTDADWHVNYSLFLRDPFTDTWMLPAYNGNSISDPAWAQLENTAKALTADNQIKQKIGNWFLKLDQAKDSETEGSQKALRGRVKSIMEYMTTVKAQGTQADIDFLKNAFTIIEEGQEACADATVNSLDNLALRVGLYKACNAAPNSEEKLLLSAGLVRFKNKLTEVDFLRNPGHGEALEDALKYKIALEPIVKLGVGTQEQKYTFDFGQAKYSLPQAIEETFKVTTIQRLEHFFAQWNEWQSFMQRQHGNGRNAEYEALDDAAMDSGNYDPIFVFAGRKAIEALAKEEYQYIVPNHKKHYAIPRDIEEGN